MILVIITFSLVALLWAVVDLFAVVGLLGVLTGERIERCPHCHRIGLTSKGKFHEDGCPIGLWDRLGELGHVSANHWHPAHGTHFGRH